MSALHVSVAQVLGSNKQQLVCLIDELNYQGVKQKMFCYNKISLHKVASKLPVEIISSEPLFVYSINFTAAQLGKNSLAVYKKLKLEHRN
jgi:hypothetical protein